MKALQSGQQEDLPVYFVNFFQGWVLVEEVVDGCTVKKIIV